MTIEQAAAGDATLVATLIGLAVGLAIVLPSLFVLFRLVLRGRFDPAPPGNGPVLATLGIRWRRARTPRSDGGMCLAGVALLLFGGDFANAVGAIALIAFCALGTVTLLQARRPRQCARSLEPSSPSSS